MAGVTIEGIQEAQQANLRAIAVMQPDKLGRALQYALPVAHRYLVSITHVWILQGGAYRASQRMSITEDNAGARGEIFIDPNSINPRGQKPSEYGPIEEARGGSHAAYERTFKAKGNEVAMRAIAFLIKELDGN